MKTVELDLAQVKDLCWLLLAAAEMLDAVSDISETPIQFEYPADPSDPNTFHVVEPCEQFTNRLREHPVVEYVQNIGKLTH